MTTSAVSARPSRSRVVGRAVGEEFGSAPGGRGDDDGIEPVAIDVPPAVSRLDPVDPCRCADVAARAHDRIGRGGHQLGQPTAWSGEDRAGGRGARPTAAATARGQQQAALA